MGGRSPRMPRRVDSLTTEDVISFTFTNHDDMEDKDIENTFANRRQEHSCIQMGIDKFESRREFKSREEANVVKNMKETEIVGNKNEENDTEKEKLTEDKFKRETRKSTKSNKSLTLPLDPIKRKDSDSSSCDLSKVGK